MSMPLGGACSAHGENDDCGQSLFSKPEQKGHLGNVGIDGGIVLFVVYITIPLVTLVV
jgi:hypothetical protein